MTEKLKLATSFSQLKAGDLVVVKPCGHCGGTHRGMLIRFEPEAVRVFTSGIRPSVAWELLPHFEHAAFSRLVITPSTVEKRAVYLIDTGLEQGHSTERRKELAR